MRKLFLLLGIMVTSLVLVGCNGSQDASTPPSFTGIRVENANPVDGTELVRFYKQKESTVLVEISISNPSNLDIKSIVINGYTYISSRFTEASTSTTIYFNVDVGTSLGEKIYSVDRINYLDGDNTKTVEGFENNEFSVYVYKEVPTVERENYQVTKESISIDFNITDVDSVVAPNTLKAVLYAGETLITEQEIDKGLTTVEFLGLLANKHYEVKVVASYNLDDNTGIDTNVTLYSGTYSTLANGLPSSSVKNAEVTSNKVTFDIDFLDEDIVTIAGGLSVAIFNGETLVESINIMGSTLGLSFEDLLNDNDYSIKVLANYDLRDGGGTLEDNLLAVYYFTTLPREVPQPVLYNVILTENVIDFDIAIDDPDGIIDTNSIYAKLFVEGVEIDTAQVINYHADFQVNNLFAFQEVTIEIIADYDLNDGLGVQADKVIHSEVFFTVEREKPIVDIADTIVEQGYVTMAIDVTDNDTIIDGSLEAILYEGDTAVQTVMFDIYTNEIIFDYATRSEQSYYIEIVADYNLQNGEGAVYGEILRRIVLYTVEAKAPLVEVLNAVADKDSVTFDVKVTDADATIVDNTTIVYLYNGATLIAQQVVPVGTTTITFATLLSNNEYTIVVESDFDLDDGSGVLAEQLLKKHYISTELRETPTTAFENESETETSISFDADIVDNDSVIVGGTIVASLYHEDVLVDSVVLAAGGNFGIEFTNLLSNNLYTVEITVDYDLNDGDGVIEDYVLAELSIYTDAKLAPNAEFRFLESDETSITADIFVEDDFDMITGNLKAVLLLNDVPTGDELPLTVGMNSGLTFNGLFSNERYYINVVADYDQNDGEPVLTDQLLEFDFIKTVSLDDIFAEITDVATTSTTIALEVTVADVSGVITGNLQAALYISGVATGDTLPLTVGDNSVTFVGVESDTDYEIKIEADYDLNEATGPVVAGELDAIDATTLPLSAPTANIESFDNTVSSVVVNVTVTDIDGTITGNLLAVLYKDGIATGATEALVVGSNTVTFDTLFSDNEYEVKVISDYDLNDENGEQLAVVLDQRTTTTLAKAVPVVSIANLLITEDEVSFIYTLQDVDTVLVPGTVKASLWVDGVKLAEKLLFTNQVTFNVSGFLADFDFEIIITGNYDLDDNAGIVVNGDMKTLELSTLAYSAPTATITSLEIHQETIDLVINVTDVDATIAGNLVAKLYEHDALIGAPLLTIPLTAGVNEISFATTVNINEFYSVVISTDYNLLDGEGIVTDVNLDEYLLRAHNDLIPEAAVTNVVIGEDSITFDVDVYDNFTVIQGNLEAVLYLDGVEIATTPVVVGNNPAENFLGLLSARDYTIAIRADYDNGNGNGTVADYIMTDDVYSTTAKQDPTADILVDDITGIQIVFDIIVEDDSNITTLRTANLYDEDDVLVGTEALIVGNNINVTFTGLFGNTKYTLEIEMDYDLNDGEGSITQIVSELEQTTPVNVEPEALILNTIPNSSEVIVFYDFNDEDGVSTEQYIRVYDENELQVAELAIVAGEGQQSTLTGLAPNAAYTVKIESSYDLQDLDGLQTDQVLFDSEFSTLSVITIQNESINTRTTYVEVIVDDFEAILTGAYITVELKQDGLTFQTYIANTEASTYLDMINLLSGFDYTLEFTATYDVGAGNVTEVIHTHEFTTTALDAPDVTIEEASLWDNTGGNLSVDVTIAEDVDNVANDTEWYAELWVDGVLADTVDIDVLAGGNPEDALTTVVFLSQDHTDGSIYEINIIADIDMNDEAGVGEVETEVASRTFIDAGN
jgi:hypothetical protein